MSTLDEPIRSRCSIVLTCTTRSYFQCTLSKERWARVWINVTAHQEKKKNEETKTGKRRAGKVKKKKHAIDFEEPVRCSSAVDQGQHSKKIKGCAQGNWDPPEGQQPFRPNPNGVGERTSIMVQLPSCIGAEELPCLHASNLLLYLAEVVFGNIASEKLLMYCKVLMSDRHKLLIRITTNSCDNE